MSVGKRGFTLVEVLIVIVIIGVLAGLLLPGLRMVQEKARSAYCQNNLHQFGLAFSTYAAQYGGEFPGIMGDSTDYSAMGHEPEYSDTLDIYPTEFLCIFMRAEKRPILAKTWMGGYRIDKVAVCPSYPKEYIQDDPWGSYSYNGHISGMLIGWNQANPDDWSYIGCDLDLWSTYGSPSRWPAGGQMYVSWWAAIMRNDGDVSIKSQLCVVADSADQDGSYGVMHDKVFHWSETMPISDGWNPADALVRDRHNGGANMAFYDGHVEWKYKDWMAERKNCPEWMFPCGKGSGAWIDVHERREG